MQTGLHVKKALVDPALWALEGHHHRSDLVLRGDDVAARDPHDSSGRLPVEKIVTGRIEPEVIVEKGFRSLLNPSGQEMKVLVNMN